MKNILLLKIAQLAVPELKTLKVRDRDALTYIETNLLGFKQAIRTAYDQGWWDAEQAAGKAVKPPRRGRR